MALVEYFVNYKTINDDYPTPLAPTDTALAQFCNKVQVILDNKYKLSFII